MGTTKKTETRRPNKCTILVNFLMLLVGVTVIVVAVTVSQNDETYPGFDGVVGVAITCGILIIIVSLLACITPMIESECMQLTLIAFIVLTLIMEIVTMVVVIAKTKDVTEYAELHWDSMSDEQKTVFEEKNDAVGFGETIPADMAVNDVSVDAMAAIESWKSE
eukprot:CAMPEP_0197031468 /NCGR_PEP_ID=MMETSP1384-20130603/10467_1 /TAXON_ID=29189 /ORGANISM="Ammonia sp." /LENGTH=163 /DNA_ID=CAMNT_0042461001 /DNA_START=63 /DNA_END=555 /DNA_ORIENTATION=+